MPHVKNMCLYPPPVSGDNGDLTSSSVDVWDGISADTSWYNASESSFYLDSAADLAGLALITNGTAAGIARDSFAGKTIYLTKDIDLDGNEWTPIGKGNRADKTDTAQAKTPFSGTFNGGGHIISNYVINFSGELNDKNENTTALGFFATVRGGDSEAEYAYIKDVVFESCVIKTNSNTAGIVAGYSDISKFENITVRNCSVTAAEGAGGIVGRFSGFGGVYYCTNDGTTVITDKSYNAGGIVGSLNHSCEYYTHANFGSDNGGRIFYNTVDLSGSDAVISSAKTPAGGIVGTYTCNASDNERDGNIRGNSVIVDSTDQLKDPDGAGWIAGSIIGYESPEKDVVATGNSYTLNGSKTEIPADQNPMITP